MNPASQLQIRLVSPETAAPSAFARILFGEAPKRPHDFRVPLPCLDPEPQAELWTSRGPYSFTETGGMQIATSPDHCLVHASVEDDGGDLRGLSRDAYDALLEAALSRGYPNIVKAWNYIARINEGEHDIERYQQFCLGRGEIYDARLAPEERAPSATAIGSLPGEPLTVMLLTARAPVTTIENPRQVSAYNYPRQYGPRSPNFSRAAVLHAGEGRQLFISGTAAIVGHESQHGGDVSAQSRETLANLSALFQRVYEAEPEIEAPTIGRGCRLRVYVRHPEEAERVRALIAPHLASPSDLVLLRGDICRSELRVEVDGIIDQLDV